MATPAKCTRRPDGDLMPTATWAEGGVGFLLLTVSSHSAEESLGLALEQFLRRCTSLLWRGFTMKSSAPAFKHLLIRWGSFSDDMTITGIGFRGFSALMALRRS
uniref:Uncharacterized protein n=1 Tax=Arundo donax TaxID=35708 RepID=A0A0A9B7F6_ARUDO